MKVRIEFIEPVLGTLSHNIEIAKEFILSKHPDGEQKDEVISAEQLSAGEQFEKLSTHFPRMQDGRPFVWNYQVKGFFKTAALAAVLSGKIKVEELKKAGLSKYMLKRTIDLLVFVRPRKILLELPTGFSRKKLPFLQRPLRAETMRGERVALASSEMAPRGTRMEFEIEAHNPNLYPYIIQWLNYGQYSGLLQWRNAGYGSFKWREIE